MEAITSHTKAIIPVHLYGHPCDMDAIMEIAERHGLYIIEDAAEAHGAEYKGKKVGSFGNIACFSFYGNKIITTGEGGMCLTNDEELAEKMKTLRDHGMDREKKYWHSMVGFDYRMTNLQAALGVAQLSKIEKFIEDIKSMIHYGFPLYISSLLSTIVSQYLLILLAIFTSNFEIGNFNAAVNLTTLITIPILV